MDGMEDERTSFMTEVSFADNKEENDEMDQENKFKIRKKRSPSTDLLSDNQVQGRIKHNPRSMDDILLEQKPKSGKECLWKRFAMIEF